MKLVELADDPTSTAKQLCDVIRLDPLVSGKVLKISNSAFFSTTEEVTNIQKAIVLLGLNTVKNIVLSSSLMNGLDSDSSEDEFTSKLWNHLLWVACLARRISKAANAPGSDEEIYFLTGLMHDFGALILYRLFNKQYINAFKKPLKKDVLSHESEKVGATHIEVAKWVAKNWKMPHGIAKPILNHHKKLSDIEDPVSYILAISSNLSAINGICFHNYFGEPFFEQEFRYGITQQLIYEQIPLIADDVEKARVFIE